MSMLFAGSFAALLVFSMALVGLILGAIAVHKSNSPTHNEILYQPRLERASLTGGLPTITVDSNTAFTNVSLSSNSNDSAGTVHGTLGGVVSDTANIDITFTKKFDKVPTAVVLTPITPQIAAQYLTVSLLTVSGFRVTVTKSDTAALNSTSQFYYLVL